MTRTRDGPHALEAPLASTEGVRDEGSPERRRRVMVGERYSAPVWRGLLQSPVTFFVFFPAPTWAWIVPIRVHLASHRSRLLSLAKINARC